MVKEFEGKSEKEAIDKAVAELNLERERFDVEVVESSKGFLFKKGVVRIRIHYDAIEPRKAETGSPERTAVRRPSPPPVSSSRAVVESERPVSPGNGIGNDDTREEIKPEVKEDLAVYLETLIDKMGYPGNVLARQKENRKVLLDIKSDFSGILIGKKGKNLDALQLLANVYAGHHHGSLRVVVDAEDYRSRREEKLIRIAERAAKQVRKSKNSKLLEPMNPFERRLVHTALNEMDDIETKSEGEGLFKQVRVIYRGR